MGASGGLRALADWVPRWDAAFELPSLSLLLPFARYVPMPSIADHACGTSASSVADDQLERCTPLAMGCSALNVRLRHAA